VKQERENQENDVLLRHQSKVAYILGAGFSYPAGVPLLRNFLPCAFKALKENEQDRQVALKLGRLLEKYARIANAVQINLDNLEDVFCLVDLPSGAVGLKSSEEDEADRALLKEVIVRTSVLGSRHLAQEDWVGDQQLGSTAVPRRYLFPIRDIEFRPDIPRRSLNITLYEAFLSYILHCNSQDDRQISNQYDLDAIITLNYDLVIETALGSFLGAKAYYGDDILSHGAKLGKAWEGCVYTEIEPKNMKKVVPMLKLHGSVHWYCEPASGVQAAHGSREYKKNFKEVTKLWDPREDDRNVSFENVPLVPPTWRKQTSELSIFAAMVKQAIHHLRRAAKIVIIGYSMPESDAHFRYLLAKSLCTPEFPKIEVWDIRSEEDMKGRLERLFGKQNLERNRIIHSNNGFRGFVKSHLYKGSATIT